LEEVAKKEEDPEKKQGLLMILMQIFVEFVKATFKEGVKETGRDITQTA
jgi:hypothetical protein